MDMLAPSPIIDAATSVLSDCKPRTADEILDEGRKRGLFDSSMTRKHVYTSLSQYIDRAKRAQTGSDPTEYEQAVCGLFSCLGFAATHVGGLGAPDGYADALLGPLSYRVMIECKLVTPGGIAHSDAPAEAAKYKDAYHGTHCALVAPALAGEVTFTSELVQHGISAWTTNDLIQLIELGIAAYDLRSVFSQAGIASGTIEGLIWDRSHGITKRLRVIASLILQQMAAEQKLAQSLDAGTQAPLFTVDVAMGAIDATLAARGAVRGCTRAEV